MCALPFSQVLSIKNKDIAGFLKLPPVKLHCSMLAEDAIKAAVKDYKAKTALKAKVISKAVFCFLLLPCMKS